MSGNNLILVGSAGGPPPPTNIAASSITSTGFILTWDAASIPGITYKVYKAGVEVVGATSNTGSSISGLTGNTSYVMRVRAFLGTAYTDSANYTVLTAPVAPTGLAYSSSTQTSFIISWTNVSGLTYSIYNNSTLITGVTPAYTGTTINSSTNLSPVANTSYNMYVYATNSSGSTSSDVLIAWTIPNAPVYSSTGNIRSNSAYLNFTGSGGYYTAWVGSTLVPINIGIFPLSSVTITSTTGNFACGGTGDIYYPNISVGCRVIISGTGAAVITGYSNPKTYYVIGSSNPTTFQLSATQGGAAITTTNGGSTSGYTFTYCHDATILSSVSINAVTNGWFTTTTTTVSYERGATIMVSGTSPGTITGYVNPTTYYIVNTSVYSNQFQLSATFNGPPITTTASGSIGSLVFFYISTQLSSTNFTISGLTPALDNTVYLKASNPGGTATSSAVTVRAAPSAPSSIIVEPNNQCTYLLFNVPYDPYSVINSYTLRAYTSQSNANIANGGTYLDTVKNTVTTVSPVCVGPLTNGNTYYYTLTACTATGSSFQTYETGPTIAGVPTVLNITYYSCSGNILFNSSTLSNYGWDGIKAVNVCIGSGSRLCSSNINPMFCFCGITMPARKSLTFINYGTVMGCGGAGGRGCKGTSTGVAGFNGGPAIWTNIPLRIINNCTIGGGGGGGGGGDAWHGGGGGGGGGIPGGAGGTYGAAYKTSGNYAGSTAGTAGTAAGWCSSYSYYYAGNGGNGGFGRGIGSSCNPGGRGCRGWKACTTNATDTICCTQTGGSGGSSGGFCSTGGLGGGGGGGGGTYGGSGGQGGGQSTAQNTTVYYGGGRPGGTGGAAVCGNSNVTWVTKGYRGGALV
jgi:hypothetical protein